MTKPIKFEVSRIYKVDGESKLKAFVDISFGGLIIKGLRIVQGEKGLFLGMPQEQGKDGRWYSIVCPASKEVHEELTQLVLAAYAE